MDKGITIALQSLNPKTLEAVKRKNMDDGKLSEFLKNIIKLIYQVIWK